MNAEADFEAARDLARRRVRPLPDQVCFLSQQCAEKYLKAFLIAHDIIPPKVHNLGRLNDICMEIDGEFAAITSRAELLNPYGTNIRYPGEAATAEDARQAMAAASQIRTFVGNKLKVHGGKKSL